MLREKDSRPAGNRAAHDLGGSSTDTLPAQRPYPQKIHLSSDAEKYLDQLGTDLMLGNLELWQLSPALLQLHTFAWNGGYLLGHAQGIASARNEIDRLTYEADLWYFCANNKGKRPSDFYARATDALWAEATK
jgi:hypothetical protein